LIAKQIQQPETTDDKMKSCYMNSTATWQNTRVPNLMKQQQNNTKYTETCKTKKGLTNLHSCELRVARAELRLQRDELGLIRRGGINGDGRQWRLRLRSR
jgi:hypothetical protein